MLLPTLYIALAILVMVITWLTWDIISLAPRSSSALSADLERAARVRHEHAREEIQAIEVATRRLMRAVATSNELSPSTAPAGRPAARATPLDRRGPAYAPGFAWSPDPAASSTSPGRVTFLLLVS